MDVISRSLSNISSVVRLISLQFNFSNPNVVPSCVRSLPQETTNESLQRRTIANGDLVIDPVENVDLIPFLDELLDNEYELVDGIHQTRVNPKNPRQPYYMVRFVFSRREHVRSNERFIRLRAAVHQALRTMCAEAMWRVRVFLNPFFQKGAETGSDYAVSIVLEARKPLVDNLGQPLKQWRKDADGNRVGEASVLLTPDFELRFSNNEIRVE